AVVAHGDAALRLQLEVLLRDDRAGAARVLSVPADVPRHVDHDTARTLVGHARTAADDADGQARSAGRVCAGIRERGDGAGRRGGNGLDLARVVARRIGRAAVPRRAA